MDDTANIGRRRFHYTGERAFYGGMGLAILALVVAGFGPGMARTLSGSGRPPGLTLLIHLHGAVFLAWVLLFIAQGALISARAHDTHRRLGRLSLALAVAMLVLGIWVSIGQVHRGTQPPGIDPLSWLLVPLGDMVAFAALVGAGFAWRTRPQVHKRLMLGATLVMLQPAVGRLPLFAPDFLAGEGNVILAWALSLPLLAWDIVQRGRPHAASLVVIGILGAEQLLRWLVWETETWRSLARAIAGA
ncbi:MAG TPA: hypothetical protein VMG08_18290 [Allosphingosinicella sp.]|nr:hypothetical protein [Allosphingosinicella sp.]